MRILVVENSDRVPAGRLESVLTEAGVEVANVAMHAGESPEPDGWDGVVVLGGHMGAYDGEEYGWLGPEMDFIRWVLSEDIPLLGICLGSQLTAHATGGRAHLGPIPEVGFVDVHLTAAGRADPVLSQVDGPVLAVHRDTFELPAGATLLASSDRYPHAFRLGSALGLQFHPEASFTIVKSWVEAGGLDEVVEAAGTSLKRLLEEAAAHEQHADAAARCLFEAWLTNDVL